MIFIFLSYREKAHDNKNFSQKFQNLIVNDESQPIKSNLEVFENQTGTDLLN